MAFRLIADRPAFEELLGEIAGESIVAMDTEAASFHRYHDRIYLIQLSTPSLTAVIDPLSVDDLAPIGELLANPAIEKIFHDGDYDLRLFDKAFGYHAANLFDTRIAAQFVNEPGIGLGALLEKYFGIRPDKRFQRADWSERPLSRAMLDYASGDTEKLHELRVILRGQLIALGRLDWVTEECERSVEVRWGGNRDEPDVVYLRMKGAKALPRRALAILRELYNWRDGVASGLDRALFRVLGNEVLFELAERPVRDRDALAKLKGMNRDLAERRGGEMLEAIERGLALPDEELPRVSRPQRLAPDPAFEVRLERLKRVRNTQAEQLALAPGVLCPNGTLELIARAEPDSLERLAELPEVRRWQVRVLGDALIGTLKTTEARDDNGGETHGTDQRNRSQSATRGEGP